MKVSWPSSSLLETIVLIPLIEWILIPQRCSLTEKEVIHALHCLRHNLVEDEDPVSVSDESGVLQCQLFFNMVNAGTTKLIRVVSWDERLKASVIPAKCPSLTKKCHCMLLKYL